MRWSWSVLAVCPLRFARRQPSALPGLVVRLACDPRAGRPLRAAPGGRLTASFPFASFSGLVITAFSGSRKLRSWQELGSVLTYGLPGQPGSEGAERRVGPTQREGCFPVSLFPTEPVASQ